ncbi:hypothetical protein J437_LFUL011954 [Ladona fulva]|uniref:Uncharacterized protein n=1 Tax=Ladona fulva TaxID=123851 RepID=A0A8K0KCU8_LADFU|nr:hypothetical protein J437_LFUL011954 [Ladona fulva]
MVAEDGYQWTTWEAYNHILKGMVDELIKLGASPMLKVTVLQLWIRYLQILKAAFLPPGHLPKLGPAYNPRDAQVVYSIGGKGSVKRKRHSVSSVAGSDRMSFSRAKGRAKRALAKSVQSHSEASSDVSTSASELSFASSRSLRKDRYMTREGIEWEKKKKAGRLSGIENDTSSVARISRLKLLGILHLGLLLCEESIQLSDMLRLDAMYLTCGGKFMVGVSQVASERVILV